MKVLEGKSLVDTLRKAVDSASKRLWIASPYIGGWPGNVRRILGTNWQANVGDVRLLTDVDEGCFRVNTLRQFFRRGEVRTLRGLHAKVYIADEFVLITSANLTGTAFSKRYEAGVVLSGPQAKLAGDLFENWWADGEGRTETQLPPPRSGGQDPDVSSRTALQARVDLPADAEDETIPSDTFGDYTVFLEHFRSFAEEYKRVQRLWPQATLFYEVDAFLNYLYRDAPDTPSRPYARKKPRQLTPKQREGEIKRLGRQFREAWKAGELNEESATWRDTSARLVRRLMNRNKTKGLTRSEVEQLLRQLNSMIVYQLNLARVVNPRNNTLTTIRRTLRDLIDAGVPIQRRMASAILPVDGMGKAAVQELVGFYYRGACPLRNRNTNCGLRFFGYDVRVD